MKWQSNLSRSSTPHTNLFQRAFANSQDDCHRGDSPMNCPRGTKIINSSRLFHTLTPCDMTRPSIHPRMVEVQRSLFMAWAGISPSPGFYLGNTVTSLSSSISRCCFGLLLISTDIPKCSACAGLVRNINRSNDRRGEVRWLSNPFLLGNAMPRVSACLPAATAEGTPVLREIWPYCLAGKG